MNRMDTYPRLSAREEWLLLWRRVRSEGPARIGGSPAYIYRHRSPDVQVPIRQRLIGTGSRAVSRQWILRTAVVSLAAHLCPGSELYAAALGRGRRIPRLVEAQPGNPHRYVLTDAGWSALLTEVRSAGGDPRAEARRLMRRIEMRSLREDRAINDIAAEELPIAWEAERRWL